MKERIITTKKGNPKKLRLFCLFIFLKKERVFDFVKSSNTLSNLNKL